MVGKHFIIYIILFSSLGVFAQNNHGLSDFFTDAEHIESIDIGATGDFYKTAETAAVTTDTVTLNGNTRTVRKMAVDKDNKQKAQFFAYKVGVNKGLKPGDLVVLEVIYPDHIDNPMSTFVLNRGCGLQSGFATGYALGDALNKHLTSNAESIAYKHSNDWQAWRQVCYLHQNVADITVGKGADAMQGNIEDGFWVIIAQGDYHDDPLSKGSAIAGINLYRIKDPESMYKSPVFPPESLPRRHIVHRNEMGQKPYTLQRGDADNEVLWLTDDIDWANSSDECTADLVKTRDPSKFADRIEKCLRLPAKGAYDDDPVKWYENRMKFQRIIAGNGMALTLMEFGFNQMYPSINGQYPFGKPRHENLYSSIVELLANYYPDIALQNYYEYEGVNQGVSDQDKLRAEPLNREAFNVDDPCSGYGEFSFTEQQTANILSEESSNDLQQIMQKTIIEPAKSDDVAIRSYMNSQFLGPWFRPKSVALPISFDADSRAQFSVFKKLNYVISKEDLRNNIDLYEEYIDFWLNARQDVFKNMQNYINEALPDNLMNTYLTFYSKEAGPRIVGVDSIVTDYYNVSDLDFFNFNEVVGVNTAGYDLYPNALFARPVGVKKSGCSENNDPVTEMYHSDPGPYGMGGDDKVYETYPLLQRNFSALDESQVDRFRNKKSNKVVVTRNNFLNEDLLRVEVDENGQTFKKDITGYFVADMERNGHYAALSYARTLAYHDPSLIQVLSSYNYTTGYPDKIARFNKAFLALPDIPSIVNDKLSNNNNLVVRIYPAFAQDLMYVAIINPSLNQVNNATITMPTNGDPVNLVNNTVLSVSSDNKIKLSLEPGEVVSLSIYNENLNEGNIPTADNESNNIKIFSACHSGSSSMFFIIFCMVAIFFRKKSTD